MSRPPFPSTLPFSDLCRVLCVDDDPVMQRFFVAALVQPGFAVECVCDGREALDRFIADERGFDVLVVDHRMPRLNGYELVDALRRIGFGGPVLIVAAALVPADRSAYRALGVEQFLTKPIPIDALRAAVSEAARLPS
jgi:CheY-like chemotaxis protein